MDSLAAAIRRRPFIIPVALVCALLAGLLLGWLQFDRLESAAGRLGHGGVLIVPDRRSLANGGGPGTGGPTAGPAPSAEAPSVTVPTASPSGTRPSGTGPTGASPSGQVQTIVMTLAVVADAMGVSYVDGAPVMRPNPQVKVPTEAQLQFLNASDRSCVLADNDPKANGVPGDVISGDVNLKPNDMVLVRAPLADMTFKWVCIPDHGRAEAFFIIGTAPSPQA